MAKYKLISTSFGDLEVDPDTKEILQEFEGSFRPMEGADIVDGLGVIRRNSIIIPRSGSDIWKGGEPFFQNEVIKQTKGYNKLVQGIKIPEYEEWYKTSPDGLMGENIETGTHLYNNPKYFKDVVAKHPAVEMKRRDTGEDIPMEYISDEIQVKSEPGPSNEAKSINPIISPNTFLK